MATALLLMLLPLLDARLEPDVVARVVRGGEGGGAWLGPDKEVEWGSWMEPEKEVEWGGMAGAS